MMARLVAVARLARPGRRRVAGWPAAGSKGRLVAPESLAEAGHGHGVHPIPCLICRELDAAACRYLTAVPLPRVGPTSGEAA
jgi:hypothetical protein